MRKKRAVQLDFKQVRPVLKRLGWKLPANINWKYVDRIHYGKYYGYGAKELWVPITVHGGMASKPWHSHTVKFPKRIESILQKMLDTIDAF